MLSLKKNGNYDEMYVHSVCYMLLGTLIMEYFGKCNNSVQRYIIYNTNIL